MDNNFHYGSTPPPSNDINTLWANTQLKTLFMYDTDRKIWIETGPPITLNYGSDYLYKGILNFSGLSNNLLYFGQNINEDAVIVGVSVKIKRASIETLTPYIKLLNNDVELFSFYVPKNKKNDEYHYYADNLNYFLKKDNVDGLNFYIEDLNEEDNGDNEVSQEKNYLTNIIASIFIKRRY